ncbi:hypothetical protein [Acinetobacter bereziniae]|uniref:hypothetical protein n=1 Tax=Acinetobacter bereziniae TaxID=106648 RepID=UPI0012503181|nr:hypothetical protein [Acinetobacter bereziniae]
MLIVLLITCLILIFWVTKLSATIEEQKKIHQYNLERFEKKFDDVDLFFKSDQEQMNHLLDRIHTLEKDSYKKQNDF